MEPAEEIIRGLALNGRKRAKSEFGEEGFYVASADRLDTEVFRKFTRNVYNEIPLWMPRNTFHLQCELLRVPHSFSPGVKALEVAFNTLLGEHPELRGYQNASAVERAFGRKLAFAAVTQDQYDRLKENLKEKIGGTAEARTVGSEAKA